MMQIKKLAVSLFLFSLLTACEEKSIPYFDPQHRSSSQQWRDYHQCEAAAYNQLVGPNATSTEMVERMGSSEYFRFNERCMFSKGYSN
jgi:hypothetical protein